MIKKKKGFTLVELLATIIVLAIVVSISVYVGIKIIKNAKDKTYEVTINEVESYAKDYVLENNNKLVYVEVENESIEYQCVTVQNLIDFGYLENDVDNSSINDTDKIDKDKYIYVERDKDSKTVTKSVYLRDNVDEYNVYYERCGVANSNNGEIYGDIWFESNPDNSVWSKSKIVTIHYSLKNFGDYENIKNYSYSYTYYDDTVNKTVIGTNTFTSEEMTFQTEVSANKNGTIEGKIIRNGKMQTKNYNVEKVDNEGPIVKLGNYKKGNVSGSTTIPLVVSDLGIGVEYTSFTKDDIVVTIGGVNVTSFELTNNNNGNYNLKIDDSVHNGKVSITIKKDSIQDKLENKNKENSLSADIEFRNIYKITYNLNGGSVSGNPTTYTVTSESITLKNPTKSGYTFTGWTGSNGTTPQTSVTIAKGSTGDKSYTANWKSTYYTITYNLSGGSVSGNPTTYTKESNSITLKNPTKNGYTFTGWTGSNGTTPQTSVTITKGSTGNKTYTANWKTIKYTITYNLNRGSVSGNPETYTKESNNITLKNPTRDGYTFTGWTGSNGTTPQTSVTITKGSTGNKTYTANWEEQITLVDFDCGDDDDDGGPCIYDCGCGYYSGGTCGVGCFLAGTKVMTINGYKDIDKIKIGEYVLTYNEKTGNNEYQLVTNQLIHNHNDIIDDLYTLSFDDKTTLKVTSAHRFYINRDGKILWISANSLKDGDQVMYANHKFHTIINISKAELKDTVYNLTVANNHNYYVGNQKILVHNLK